MNQEKLRKEFQEFVEFSLWQGENEYTKNMPVGNVADWWLSKLKSEREEMKKEMAEEMRKFTEGFSYRPKGIDLSDKQ